MKTEVPHLVKVAPGILVNQDSGGIKAYKAKLNAEQSRNDEINSLKNEMSEIKSMLKTLLERI